MTALYVYSIIPIILLFTPSVILILMPNRWSWLILTVSTLFLLFGGLAWHVIQDSFMKNSQNLNPIINLALCIVPALLAKIFAIISRNRKLIKLSRMLPLLALLGPTTAVCLSYICKKLICASLLHFLVSNYALITISQCPDSSCPARHLSNCTYWTHR